MYKIKKHFSTLGKTTVLLATLFIITTTTMTGCVTVAVAALSAGTVAYVRGDLATVKEATLNQCWTATRSAVADLGFAVEEESINSLNAKLTTRTADGDNVKISLKKESESLTKISIRIGTFGNESMSRLILDKIESNL